MLKIQLEEQIRKLQDLKQSLTKRIGELQDDVKTLENEKDDFKQLERRWEDDRKDFDRIQKMMADIISGEASSEAKIEVLKDLLGIGMKNVKTMYPY